MKTRLNTVLQTVAVRLAVALLLFSLIAPGVSAQLATTLQVIHNAPEPSLSPIAVWAGIPLGGSTTFLPVTQNLSFRSATQAFSGFPPSIQSLSQLAGLPLQANLTRVTSTNGTNEVIRGIGGLRLGAGANFVIAQGLADTTGYAANPQGRGRALNLNVITDTLSIPEGFTRLIYVHGSTDAPQIEIVIRELNRIVVRSMGYNELVGDLIPTADYTVDIYTNSGATLVNSFLMPLRQLRGDNQRFVIMATGFLNPAQNRNGAALGILAVPHTSPSTSSLLATTTPPASNPFGMMTLPALSLQAVHASADPAASAVGVWLGAMLMPNVLQFFPVAPNFLFRTSTPAITSITTLAGVVPLAAAVGTSFSLNITAPNQSTASPALRSFSGYSLQQGGNWAVAEGVVDTTRFARNPSGLPISLTVRPLVDIVTSVSNQQVRLRFINSVTDSRPIELVLRGFNAAPIGPLIYGQTSIIAEFPASDYTFDVRYAGTTEILGTFRGEFGRQNLGGKRVLIAATGFISPLRNQGGPSLGLLTVVNDSTGRSFMMPTIALSVRDAGGITFQANGMTIYPVAPNPARDQASISFSLNELMQAELRLMDMQGKTLWTLPTQTFAAGKHTQIIDVQNLSQGSYIVQLSNGAGRSVTTRLVVVR
jgi:hypothetical protein